MPFVVEYLGRKKTEDQAEKSSFVGAVFWFVLSMLLVYLAWFVIGKLYSRHLKINR